MQALFRNRNFRLLWLALIVSGVGDVLYNVGVMVSIFERTGSALQTAGALVATSLPKFLLGPVAGALVDRYSRRAVMVAMDALRAALLVGLLLLVIGGGWSVTLLYLVVAALSVATTFHVPARQAIIPSLVPRSQLVRANSLLMATNQGTMAVGYLVGGLLIVTLGFERLVLLDGLSFVVAAGLTALLRPTLPAPVGGLAAAPVTLGRAVVDGVRYLRHHALPRTLVTMEVLEHVPHGVWTSALMLVFVQEALGGTVEQWGVHNAAYFIGQLVGAVVAALAAAWLARRPGWLIIGNAALFALLTAIYALSPSLLFATILAFFFGPSSMMRDVAQDSLLQATVAPDVLGRVFAMRNMLFNLTFMAAGLLFAWLADGFPVRGIYLAAAGLYVGTALYAVASPTMRAATMEEAVALNV